MTASNILNFSKVSAVFAPTLASGGDDLTPSPTGAVPRSLPCRFLSIPGAPQRVCASCVGFCDAALAPGLRYIPEECRNALVDDWSGGACLPNVYQQVRQPSRMFLDDDVDFCCCAVITSFLFHQIVFPPTYACMCVMLPFLKKSTASKNHK